MDNLKSFSQSKFENSLYKKKRNKDKNSVIKDKSKKKFYTKNEDFLIDDCKIIKDYLSKSIVMSTHAESRRIKRNISIKDIKKCIMHGICINVEYIKDTNKYIYKYEYNKICVVFSMSDKPNIITVYHS